MATVYVLKLECPGGAMKRTTMTQEEWESTYSHSSRLAIYDSDGDLHDISTWIAEIQYTHNELDADGSGRDTATGLMKRTYVATKHSLNIKVLNKAPQSIARYIFSLVRSTKNKVFFDAITQHPCSDAFSTHTFYCSTINFGAQRYDKQGDFTYYDGMNFNIIQK